MLAEAMAMNSMGPMGYDANLTEHYYAGSGEGEAIYAQQDEEAQVGSNTRISVVQAAMSAQPQSVTVQTPAISAQPPAIFLKSPPSGYPLRGMRKKRN